MIEQKLEAISTFPLVGTPIMSYINDVSLEFESVRKLNIKNYTILYAYTDLHDLATITHIFHQTQDYGKIFQT